MEDKMLKLILGGFFIMAMVGMGARIYFTKLNDDCRARYTTVTVTVSNGEYILPRPNDFTAEDIIKLCSY